MTSERYEKPGDESEVDTTPPKPRPATHLIEKAKQDIPIFLLGENGPIVLLASEMVECLEKRFGQIPHVSRWAIHELAQAKLLKALHKNTMPPGTPILSYSEGGNPQLKISTGIPSRRTDNSIPLDEFKLKATEALWEWWNSDGIESVKPLVTPIPEPVPNPNPKPLKGWAEICSALDRQNNKPNQRDIRQMAKDYPEGCPIEFGDKRQTHPTAKREPLLEWWNEVTS